MNPYLWLNPYATGAATNTYSTLTITGANTPYGPSYSLPRLAENAVIPDSPETWLRRRVQEVCDLSKLSAA